MFTAAFSICVMLGVVATFVTYLGTRARTTRVVVVSTLVALVAAAGCLRYEVEVRDLDPWYPSALAQLQDRLLLRPKRATSGGPARSLEAYQKSINPHLASLESFRAREQLLGRWAQSFQKPGSENTGTVKPVLVVVATSGGALRAAIWTETVLGYLDDKIPDFHHHVRVMTGASGGMLGAARYVSGHFDDTGVVGAPDRPLVAPDYLTPIAWQIAFRDFFPNSLVPWATYNRGDALEDAWIDFDKGIGHTFGQIKDKEYAGLIPSIIFSPMLVEDGRRLLISNLPLQDLAFIQGKALMADDEQTLRDQYRGYNPTKPEPDLYDLEYPDLASVSAVELFGLFGEAGRDNLKLASAVRMSATFPYVTSAVALPTDPPRHAVDAGYYDNYGINLATAWVFSHRVWIARNTSGVLVVQSRAFRNEKRLKILSEDIHDSAANDQLESHEWISVAKVAHFLPALASLVADGVRSLVSRSKAWHRLETHRCTSATTSNSVDCNGCSPTSARTRTSSGRSSSRATRSRLARTPRTRRR